MGRVWVCTLCVCDDEQCEYGVGAVVNLNVMNKEGVIHDVADVFFS
jgi:hypothetical protein